MAYTTIREGSRGEDVKRLQTLLNNEGYSLDVDGIFGEKTQSAVRHYQKNQGLDVDGIVGMNTWSALSSPTTAQPSAAQTPMGQVDVAGGRDLTGASNAQIGLSGNQSSLGNQPTYVPSQAVLDAENALKQWETNRPEEYESPYADQLAALYDQIVGRGEFSYSPQADPLYEMYKDRYTVGGQQAMQDTMANAAALSGGYANSYAQTVGQQQMGAYMTALANVLPELEARAYERWRDEGTDLYNQFQLTQGLDAADYDRYRDTVGDYYNDLGYAYGKWQDLYGNDYNRYLNALAAWQDARDFAYQQQLDALAQQNYEREWAYRQQQDAQKSSGSSSAGSGRKNNVVDPLVRNASTQSTLGTTIGAIVGLVGQQAASSLDEEVMDLYDNMGGNARTAIENSAHSTLEKNYMRKQLEKLEQEYGKK